MEEFHTLARAIEERRGGLKVSHTRPLTTPITPRTTTTWDSAPTPHATARQSPSREGTARRASEDWRTRADIASPRAECAPARPRPARATAREERPAPHGTSARPSRFSIVHNELDARDGRPKTTPRAARSTVSREAGWAVDAAKHAYLGRDSSPTVSPAPARARPAASAPASTQRTDTVPTTSSQIERAIHTDSWIDALRHAVAEEEAVRPEQAEATIPDAATTGEGEPDLAEFVDLRHVAAMLSDLERRIKALEQARPTRIRTRRVSADADAKQAEAAGAATRPRPRRTAAQAPRRLWG